MKSDKYRITVYFNTGNMAVTQVSREDAEKISTMEFGRNATGRILVGEFGSGKKLSLLPLHQIQAISFEPEADSK